MSDTYSKISATVKTFLSSYQATFSEKDPSKLSTTLTPDCIRSMQPKAFAETLGLSHNPISVADYENIAKNEVPALTVGQIDLEQLTVDTEKKTASIKVNIHVEMKDGPKEMLEFVYFLDFTDSCDQIKAVVQFADTAKINDIVAMIKDIMTNQQ